MILFRLILGLLKRDARFKALDKTSVPFYDRVMEIIPKLNRKLPSKFSRALIARHYFLKYRSPLYPFMSKFKALRWSFRLRLSKKIQESLYISSFKPRAGKYLGWFVFGIIAGDAMCHTENLPGHEAWSKNFFFYPRTHWMLPYIIEDTHSKGSEDYFKKDSLALGIDRMIMKGIEDKEMDSLSWMVLGARFASMQESEFSYLAFQMAHMKDYQKIGGNSMQPVEGMDASRFFSKDN